MLDTGLSYNPVQCQKKLMMQPWENGENPNFRPNFLPSPSHFFLGVLPLLVRHCSKPSSYSLYSKTNELNLTKWQKTYFWVWFCPVLAQIWSQKLFFVGFTSTAKLGKMAKNIVSDPILVCLAQILLHKSFLRVLFPLLFRHCFKLSSYAI